MTMKKREYDQTGAGFEGNGVKQDWESEIDEQRAIQELQAGLGHLDKQLPDFTPNLRWFEQQVAEGKRKHRTRLIRDLILFWSMAMLLLTISYMILTSQPIVYIYLQALALVVPGLMLAYSGKQVNTSE
jgi:hypothetical protein